jgi:MFS family permease
MNNIASAIPPVFPIDRKTIRSPPRQSYDGFGRHRVLRAALFGIGASVALLIFTGNPILIHFGSALSGMCIGPVYPLALSFLLERSSRGWVFAVGGIGAVFFPWLTGLLSAHCGSIRYGLIAPCVGVLLMIASESVQSWGRR